MVVLTAQLEKAQYSPAPPLPLTLVMFVKSISNNVDFKTEPDLAGSQTLEVEGDPTSGFPGRPSHPQHLAAAFSCCKNTRRRGPSELLHKAARTVG